MTKKKVNKLKKILMICLVSSFYLLPQLVQAAPNWVPKEKREQFDRVITQAKEYAKVLKTDPKIVKTKVVKEIKDANGKTQKGIFFIATVQRATLKTDIVLEIDSNENIKDIRMDGDKLIIEYKSKTLNTKDKVKYGAAGGAAGGLIVLLLVLLI
jgi:hypothetical protein